MNCATPSLPTTAAYVALAEALGAALLTADARLSRAMAPPVRWS